MFEWRDVVGRVADLIDRATEPGWKRKTAFSAVAIAILLIPYPVHVAGEFEIIYPHRSEARPMTEGILAEVLVHSEEDVDEGQVVARLLDTDLKLERAKLEAEADEAHAKVRYYETGYRKEKVEQAQFRVQELQAAASLASKNLQREQQLHRAGVSSKEQLEASESEYRQKQKTLEQANEEFKRLKSGYRTEEIEQARASAAALQAQIQALDQKLAWTEVRAPATGIVVTPEHELFAQIGSHATRGSTILEIVDTKEFVARIMVPEAESGDVAVNQVVQLRAYQLPNESFEGTIEQIEPRVEKHLALATHVPVLARVKSDKLRLHATGKAKVTCGDANIGLLIYRRFLHSFFVQMWSWY
jgi:multidrug resistance efflux pump